MRTQTLREDGSRILAKRSLPFVVCNCGATTTLNHEVTSSTAKISQVLHGIARPDVEEGKLDFIGGIAPSRLAKPRRSLGEDPKA